MPRKVDPKASVLAYFATVSAEEARDTLALAREILRQRQPLKRKTRKGGARAEEASTQAAH